MRRVRTFDHHHGRPAEHGRGHRLRPGRGAAEADRDGRVHRPVHVDEPRHGPLHRDQCLARRGRHARERRRAGRSSDPGRRDHGWRAARGGVGGRRDAPRPHGTRGLLLSRHLAPAGGRRHRAGDGRLPHPDPAAGGDAGRLLQREHADRQGDRTGVWHRRLRVPGSLRGVPRPGHGDPRERVRRSRRQRDRRRRVRPRHRTPEVARAGVTARRPGHTGSKLASKVSSAAWSGPTKEGASGASARASMSWSLRPTAGGRWELKMPEGSRSRTALTCGS